MDNKKDLSATSDGLPTLKSLMKLKKKYDAPDLGSLPEGYKNNSDKERLYLWSADNFRRQIQHKHPTLKPLCLTSKNECGTEKLTMTFIKPTILPYSHLFSLTECSKFISNFLFYRPREYDGSMWSPTYVLATQIGSSLEMSTVLASFLIGFGFQAFVVCGWVDKATSLMDQRQEKCPQLIEEDVNVEKDSSHLSTKYTPKKPPELKSKYMQFLGKLKANAESAKRHSIKPGLATDILNELNAEVKAADETEHFFHAWVYVDIVDAPGFFIESTTGERKPLNHPSYKSINSAWNHENYWLNKQLDEEWKNGKSLDLIDESKWIKFVCHLDMPKKEESQDDSPKRLLNNLHSWLSELVIPKDCFELMYRLGQKTAEFKNVTVEYFAAYLLKDGMTQRVTQYKGDDEKEDEDDLDGESDEFEEEDLEECFGEGDEEEEMSDEEEAATDDYEEESENDTENKLTVEEERRSEHEADGKIMVERPPQVVHVTEKFRFRLDKLVVRETFPLSDKVIERFAHGRKDRLSEHEFYKVGAAILGGEAEDVTKYYSASRVDGLTKRVWKDMEIIEEYEGRPDHLIHMYVQFIHAEKKFGPAGDTAKSAREICRIVETYGMHPEKGTDGDADESNLISPGRILDTVKGIMERTYDIEGHRILLKFHREKGQIFCKTVEFFEPRERGMAAPVGGQGGNPASKMASAENSVAAEITLKDPELTPNDVKVYLVDPRDEKPCLRELADIYKEQVELQKSAIKRVAVIETEMDRLLENRMKELSANEMEVWVFDTKRNSHVLKGRLEQEQQARKKQESIMDLELDFLAPYLERFPNVNALTRAQAIEIRDECLNNIRTGLEEKEKFLEEQINCIQEEMRMKKKIFTKEDFRSKKFMLNVLETRLARQKRETLRVNNQAEKKIKNDPRLLAILAS